MAELIHSLIVDDEQHARDSLIHLLESHGTGIKIIGQASSASEAREALEKNKVEAIFLDISMPNEGGFDLLESLDSSRYLFVFVTAFEEFALRALKASAVDYLQKPIDAQDLVNTVAKLHQLKKLRSQSSFAVENYKQALENLVNNNNEKVVQRLCLPGMHGFSIIDVSEILYICAEGNYTVFHLIGLKKIVVSKPISEFEEILDPLIFFRNHKSSIINLKYLKEYSKIDGYYAVMADNKSISISRRRLPDFFKAVDDYNATSYSR